MNTNATSSLIWSVADLLRGNFKQSEYGRVILPFTILRRLDCVLEATKPAVLKEHQAKKDMPAAALDRFLAKASGYENHKNMSEQVMGKGHVKKAMAALLLDLVYRGFEEKRQDNGRPA